ncbi:MAG: hypothetical protein JWO14_3913 [Solirubrobacterales bacterium]|nr:hypothetical protein [Solirubrobacterales bacterium]
MKRFESSDARRVLVGMLSMSLALLALAVAASGAQAAKGAVSSFGGAGTSGGKFGGSIPDLAVNQAGTGGAGSGDIYALDETIEGGSRIQVFTPSGEFVRAFGLDVGGAGVEVCTVAATCGPVTSSAVAGGIAGNADGLAIDQAAGTVYVADRGNNRVDVFSASGSFEGAFGWRVKAAGAAEELQFCTTLTGCQEGKAGAGAGQFSRNSPLGEEDAGLSDVAVNPLNGHILTTDSKTRRISEFAPVISGGVVTGITFVRGYGWGAQTGASEFQICTTSCHAPGPPGSAEGQFGTTEPRVLAIDSEGTVYAVDSRNRRVQTFGPDGSALGDFAGPSLNEAPTETIPSEIAIDPSNGHLLVLAQTVGHERRPYEFDAAGNLLEIYFPSGGFASSPLAVGPTGQLYGATNRRIYRLGTIVPPAAEITEVEAASGTSAVVKAKINPNGLEVNYRVELSSDGGATWVPMANGEFPDDEADHEITVNVSPLEALTTYRVRVVAEKVFASGSATAEEEFETPAAPPELTGVGYSGNTDTCVDLAGDVNPENQATMYRFEYTSEADFILNGFGGALSAPSPAATIPAGPVPVVVDQRICGLSPRTTYHFRLVAENATGPSTSADATFTTFATAGSGLPDERAYEQASPVDKNGADVKVLTDIGQVAASGDAVTFYTNAGLPGGDGAQSLPTFMSRRDASGWTTQGLLPPASVGPEAKVLGWTEDLTRSYSAGLTPGSPITLYEQNTLTRGVRAVSTDPEAINVLPTFAAATEEGKALLFEDRAALTSGAMSGHSNVYLWDSQTNRLVLAGAMNNGQAPSAGAFAGPYDWFSSNGTSQGGSAAGYYTNESNVLSTDADRVFFTAAGTGRLYMRVNPEQAQSAVDGEGRCTEGSKACTVPISDEQQAIFVGATPAGRQTLLMSSSPLTADANTGPTHTGRDLYLYDADAGKLTDLTPEEGGDGAEVKGVLGYGEEGGVVSYVYFLANGSLAEGAAAGSCGVAESKSPEEGLSGECNLYVWHAGSITYIGRLAPGRESKQIQQAEMRDWAPTTRVALEKVRRTARVSEGGAVLLFRSYLKLTSYENAGVPEMYRYDAETRGLRCVSCDPTGAPAVGGASVSDIFNLPLSKPASTAAITSRNLSANGNRVFFDTPDKLISTDVNGVDDVYEWEASGEGSCTSESQDGGCLYLISTGTSPRPSYFVDASTDGDDVFILTAQPLVTQDKDELDDVYDARVRGGIPAQNQVEPTPCADEQHCAGMSSGAPPTQQPGSPAFVGPGNPKPIRCKKGLHPVTKKGKETCVKVKSKKRTKHRHHKAGGRSKAGAGHKHRRGGSGKHGRAGR